MKNAALALLALVLSPFISVAAFGQTNANLASGLTPYNSFIGGSIDSVNLNNGNLTVHIPLFSYPQRGSLKEEFYLVYNNKNYSVVQNCNPRTGVCADHWAWGIWGQSTGFSIRNTASLGTTFKYVSPWPNPFFTATTWDGSTHQLGNGVSIDATAIKSNMTTDLASLITRDRSGNQSGNQGPQDTNGNFVSIGSSGKLIDTLGRTIMNLPAPPGFVVDTTACTGALPRSSYSVKYFSGPNGNTRTVMLCYASIRYKTDFKAINNIDGPIAETSGVREVLQSAVIYNGSSWATSPAWTFGYDTAPDSTTIAYGDLTSITLPTGGRIVYTYGNRFACNSNLVLTTKSRAVISRGVDSGDGAGLHVTTYSGGVVTDPLGNDTVHTFGAGTPCTPYETLTQYYSGSKTTGTLLKTVQTDYSSTTNPWDIVYGQGPTVANVVPIRITTT